MKYEEFIASKASSVEFDSAPNIGMAPHLFGFQADLVRWALKRGRAAIFADTGLGKSYMQIEWARNVATVGRVLMLAPLAVADQTVREAAKVGVEIAYRREDMGDQITITNYEMLHHFDPSQFVGIVLDESSILKAFTGATRNQIIEAFGRTPYRLACTATPAPNDFTELGNHSEFLGVLSRVEMLAEYFTHDGGSTQDWRLKGHAIAAFWTWVSSWGAVVRKPSALGYPDDGYNLPPLKFHEHVIKVSHEDAWDTGALFVADARTLNDQRAIRRTTEDQRVAIAVLQVQSSWGMIGLRGPIALEAGAQNEPAAEADGGSGVPRSGAANDRGSGRDEDGRGEAGKKGLPGAVREGQPGEVPSNPGAADRVQPSSTGEVRDRRDDSRASETTSPGVADREPAEAEGATASKVRADDGTVRTHAESAGREVPDLRALGHERPELLPGGGSLSRDGQGSGVALHELQPGTRKVPGRPLDATGSSGVPLKPWLIWCELNSEQDALEAAFGDFAFSVRGADSFDDKVDQIRRWLDRERPIMISKPSVIGFGMNFQHCSRMLFLGPSNSYEQTYQAIRRCWRFGQKMPVDVHIVTAENERAILQNLRRKEADADRLAEETQGYIGPAMRSAIGATERRWNPYNPTTKMEVPSWLK